MPGGWQLGGDQVPPVGPIRRAFLDRHEEQVEPERVYVDLYAGAGYNRIQGTRTFLKGSPIIALTVACPFDKYIFCEESSDLLGALKARVDRISPGANVTYIHGNCDSEIDNICAAIPK